MKVMRYGLQSGDPTHVAVYDVAGASVLVLVNYWSEGSSAAPGWASVIERTIGSIEWAQRITSKVLR